MGPHTEGLRVGTRVNYQEGGCPVGKHLSIDKDAIELRLPYGGSAFIYPEHDSAEDILEAVLNIIKRFNSDKHTRKEVHDG